MPIICLEGASAVGKSSTCRAFAKHYDAYIVEETYFLFGSPPAHLTEEELVLWFIERQADRWSIALEQAKQHEYVLLDGDIFKQWYDWIYGFGGVPLAYRANLLSEMIQARRIGLPQRYVILWTDEATLRMHKLGDTSRTRSNFEQHLQLIQPQLTYFKTMGGAYPGLVQFHQVENVEQNVASLVQAGENCPQWAGCEQEWLAWMTHFFANHTAIYHDENET
ncbi:hypothetical protein [Paenibacillus sp. 481]|uniref:hypothetical protein n=1 Tax=Paenibacillus sp. 481 TaxID=2835869 RepID=UPI001E4BD5C4|nr:hypothetical protein [Paenibacillus sp. 481]UHA72780.1 ATP-binding protein [Paenibacillus sp. 481]